MMLAYRIKRARKFINISTRKVVGETSHSLHGTLTKFVF